MSTILTEIRRELKQNSDEAVKASGRKFFKEQIKPYGVKTAVVKIIAKKYFKAIKDTGKANIFDLCEKLWQSGYMEESFIASEWSYYLRKDYEPEDFTVFQKWVDTHISNWASCDTFCNHTMGAFVEMYPQFLENLKTWSWSSNRWTRRASAVSLILPAKRGLYLKEILEIADILLTDPDDLVQKGYGWMLKAASHAHRMEIFDYVMKKKNIMPRTALRYAIEKMPRELKMKAMEK
ncbi:MAG: DNA alkylation repair protein [Spirochaetae bacterium HGW-Spirochaetae-1]|jgi:3-methyladenine DNA glycosylase AlkD|nr:MAG: DNA alkylation repair protein [Spirochaetae bacterium HGW-Spirochaetae-1]